MMRFGPFLRNRDGGVALMAGLLSGVLLFASAMAVEVTGAVNQDAELQKVADTALIAAATAYRDTGNKADARRAGENFFQNAAQIAKLADASATFDLKKDNESGAMAIRVEATATVQSLLGFALLPSAMHISAFSKADVKDEPIDLYLVMMIDSTGSMATLISSVKEAALDLEQTVRDDMLARGLPLDKLFVKVAFFGDLRLDPTPDGWLESRVFEISKPGEVDALRSFVGARATGFGYDTAESSPAAIAHFVTAPLPAQLDPARTAQALVLWTDAPGLPLSHATISDDITVKLYEAHGRHGNDAGAFHIPDGDAWDFNIVTELYGEEGRFDGDATGRETAADAPAYGCCSSLAVLEDRWRSYGAVPLKKRVMGLIVPTAEKPWGEVSQWPNVTVKDYTTPTAAGILDDVLETLTGEESPLLISG